MKNQNLPPVGTPVFNAWNGWGEIVINNDSSPYPIHVKFSEDTFTYTNEGCNRSGEKFPTLSLTEYDLIKGGFTPISDWNKPKVGDMGYFWDDEATFTANGCLTRMFSLDKFELNNNTHWQNFSPTIPEWYTEKLNEIKKGLQK